jgi:hypothetical protein
MNPHGGVALRLKRLQEETALVAKNPRFDNSHFWYRRRRYLHDALLILAASDLLATNHHRGFLCAGGDIAVLIDDLGVQRFNASTQNFQDLTSLDAAFISVG